MSVGAVWCRNIVALSQLADIYRIKERRGERAPLMGRKYELYLIRHPQPNNLDDARNPSKRWGVGYVAPPRRAATLSLIVLLEFV